MSIAIRLTRPCLYHIQRPIIRIPSTSNYLKLTPLCTNNHLIKRLSTTAPTMSFSNADTGDKPADPYKEVNKTEPALKEKVEDLVSFIESCKFGMMTTRIESSGLLVSRCMALAAKVCFRTYASSSHWGTCQCTSINDHTNLILLTRRVAALTSSSTPTPNPAKPTT